MNKNLKIIIVVLIAFMLLGCTCSCKNKSNEYFTDKKLSDTEIQKENEIRNR
jgi:outer membrane biogenesis lipoprotein LolB